MSDTTTNIGIVPMPDRDSEHYFAALAEGRLELQRCEDCGHWTWPPRPICSNCHGDNLVWQPVAGTGAVYTWVVTHHAYFPSLQPIVPYTTVFVRLDEQDDIMIPGRLLSDVEPHQGLRVRAVPEQLTDDIGHLNWQPIG